MSLLDPDLPADVTGWDRLSRPVWLYDPATSRGLYANAAALALWGAESLAELLSRDFSKLSPAVRTRTDRLAAATAGGDTVTEQWTFYPQGRPVTVQAVISNFRLQDDRRVLLFEAAPIGVEEAERRAAEALRHTSSLITLFDTAGCALFANPAAYAVYGLEERGFVLRFSDPAHGAEILARVIAGEVIAELCLVNTTAGERAHHLDARQVTDPVTGVAGVLLSERDVTAQVQAEKALAAADERAELATAKQRFLTTMSHELRTPLNGVIGFADLLAATSLQAPQAAHVARIAQGGRALLAVINDMIAVSERDFVVPAPGPAAPEAAIPQAAETQGVGNDAPLRILYADDNEANRALVQVILQTQGVDCDLVEDGAQAVAAARGAAYDLILMDIQMPVMDGVAAARAIRAVSDVPILALTANTLEDQIAGYLAAGMQDCLAKPIEMLDLITKVAFWTDGPSERSSTASEAHSPPETAAGDRS